MSRHGEGEHNKSFKVGVQCIVMERMHVLLGRRQNRFGAGSWGLPGGHLERGESIREAAVRELLEETGLRARELRLVAVADPILENNFHLQFGMHISSWEGVPIIQEPQACSGLEFFPLSALPQPMFISSLPLLHHFKEGTLY